MAIVRQDVATLGPGWNKTLLNYALAMRELDKLPLSDRNSWKFLGAVHGFSKPLWVSEGLMSAGETTPADLTNNTYGNQCQHSSWFFLPWHRGYLFAFEKIVAAKVKEITGDDWALPYWNYLDDTNSAARRIPDAFLEDTLPDGIPNVPNGTPNPLKKYPRRPGVTELEPEDDDELTLQAMEEDDFLVGAIGVNGAIGLGGGISNNFIQFGSSAGDLELDPHNTVHRLVGSGGFMGDPRLAGLDPIFWLHHCNVDRLWEAWMRTPGKNMVKDPRWLNGPANRTFIMPQLGGANPGMTFTGKDTLLGGKLQPTYDNLTKGTGVTPGAVVVARVGMGPPEQQKVESIGANADAVSVGAAPVRTQVALERTATTAGVVAMGATEPGKEVARFYLSLESVRGKAPSPLLEVYVNLPEGDDPKAHPDLRAGRLTLFGLNVASEPDGSHGGNGLGFTLDITDLAKRLQTEGKFDPGRLTVTLVPGEQISAAQPVSVDKITVLKRTGIVK